MKVIISDFLNDRKYVQTVFREGNSLYIIGPRTKTRYKLYPDGTIEGHMDSITWRRK